MGVSVVGEHNGRAGHGVDAAAPDGGLLHPDGRVGGSRGENPEDGGDLVGALGQGDGHGVALPHTVVPQQGRHLPRHQGEFGVRQRGSVLFDDGEVAGPLVGEPEEARVQNVAGLRGRRQGGDGADREPVGGQQRSDGQQPGL